MQINRSRSSHLPSPPPHHHLENFLSGSQSRPSTPSRSFLPSSSHFTVPVFSFPLFSLVRENPPANKRVTPSHLTRGTRAGTARVAVFIKSQRNKMKTVNWTSWQRSEEVGEDGKARKKKEEKGEGKKVKRTREREREKEEKDAFPILNSTEYGIHRLIPLLSTVGNRVHHRV